MPITLERDLTSLLNDDVSSLDRVINSDDGDVFFNPQGDFFEPEYIMAFEAPNENKIIAKVATTGEITTLYSSNGDELTKILDLDQGYHYYIDRKALHSLSISSLESSITTNPESVLKIITDTLRRRAEEIKEYGNAIDIKLADEFFVQSYQNMKYRWYNIKDNDSDHDIIAKRSPSTVFIKAGDGCIFRCDYCPTAGTPLSVDTNFDFFTRAESTKKVYEMILGERFSAIKSFFLNISDAGFNEIYMNTIHGRRVKIVRMRSSDLSFNEQLASKKREMSLKEEQDHLNLIMALTYAKTLFYSIETFGAFMGTNTALTLSYDPTNENGKELKGIKYSSAHFRWVKRYADSLGVGLSFYDGIETAHNEASRLVSKPFTYDEKLLAAQLIMEAGIQLNVIFQGGMYGYGIVPRNKDVNDPDSFIPIEEILAENIRWVNELNPKDVYRASVKPPIISLSTHIGGDLPINRLYEEGRIKPYLANEYEERVTEEFDTFTDGISESLRTRRVILASNYETILPHYADTKEFANWMS